jgi:lanosterol synthase
MYSSFDVADTGKEPFTDYSRWRLLVNDGGRHTWKYLKSEEEVAAWPQNMVDKYWLGLPLVSILSLFEH